MVGISSLSASGFPVSCLDGSPVAVREVVGGVPSPRTGRLKAVTPCNAPVLLIPSSNAYHRP